MSKYKNTNKSRKSAGFTVMELGVVGAMFGILMLLVLPILIYDGERQVNDQTVDCIGVFGEEPQLPEGYHWQVEWNPIVPSIVWFGFIGPAVTLLTDAKCPVPKPVIPGAERDATKNATPTLTPDATPRSDAG